MSPIAHRCLKLPVVFLFFAMKYSTRTDNK